jgi:asparagine synthase (glutamine-hydrolysing)
VVELSERIQATRKMDVLNEKAIIKRALADVIPEAIRRRKKQPYRAPDASSFFDVERHRGRAPWVDALLEPESIRRTGIFEPKAVSLLAAKARKGRAVGAKDNMALVAILSTELLQRQLVEGVEVG